MNTTKHPQTTNIDDKIQKISALRDLANNEIATLINEKREIVKRLVRTNDQKKIEKLRAQLGIV